MRVRRSAILLLAALLVLLAGCGRVSTPVVKEDASEPAAVATHELAWVVQEVDVLRSALGRLSIALDDDGSPHVAYYATTPGETGYEIWYAYLHEDGVWRTESVGDTVGVAHGSLALDGSGRPHVAYVAENPSATAQELVHVTRTDGVWSAPEVVDNVFVGNISGDDAGGLFIGGQEHRYDAPLDPYPDSAKFNVRVEGNVFMGNAQSSGNSGAGRITMETRATLRNNIVAHNNGGLYLQRSEIVAENNTVWQDWRVIEDKKGLGESRFSGNILKDLMGGIDARATFTGNMVPPVVPGRGNMKVEDVFVDDSVTGAIESSSFDPLTLTTTLRLTEPLPTGKDFTARPINIDRGLWRVIKTAAEHEIVIWGRPRVSTTGYKTFEIPRSFTLRDDAPKGIGATPIRN